MMQYKLLRHDANCGQIMQAWHIRKMYSYKKPALCNHFAGLYDFSHFKSSGYNEEIACREIYGKIELSEQSGGGK